MKDALFKKLDHKYLDFKTFTRGQQLAEGYKPDIVLKKSSKYVILESEHGPSRKHFLGGLVKAGKFLSGKNSGILVFVILIKTNTTEYQISNHLSQYLKWIKPLTNLEEVYVISDVDYCPGKNPLEICGTEFLTVAERVS
ncbi:MAG: hypothetical protein RIG68_08985 [Imperialibacter sp.]|uniref:hypothetical protein n=1 Tax=Imperialibacter sp. TaxID=2038411 RepID=UPI0032EDFCD5